MAEDTVYFDAPSPSMENTNFDMTPSVDVASSPSLYDRTFQPTSVTSAPVSVPSSGAPKAFDFSSVLNSPKPGVVEVSSTTAAFDLMKSNLGGIGTSSEFSSMWDSSGFQEQGTKTLMDRFGFTEAGAKAQLNGSVKQSMLKQLGEGLSVTDTTVKPGALESADTRTFIIDQSRAVLNDPNSKPGDRILAKTSMDAAQKSLDQDAAYRKTIPGRAAIVASRLNTIEATEGQLSASPLVSGSQGAKQIVASVAEERASYKKQLLELPGFSQGADGKLAFDSSSVSDTDLVTIKSTLDSFDRLGGEWSGKLSEVGGTYYDKNFFVKATPLGQTQVKWESVMGAVGLISPFVMYYLQQMENDENWDRQLDLAETQRQWDREDMATMQGYRLEQIAAQGEASGTSGARSAPASGGGGYGGSGVGVA